MQRVCSALQSTLWNHMIKSKPQSIIFFSEGIHLNSATVLKFKDRYKIKSTEVATGLKI